LFFLGTRVVEAPDNDAVLLMAGITLVCEGTLMTIFANKRSSAAFPLKPVAAGCALFVAAFASPAFAQTSAAPQATDAPVASVVVSGIRRGIEDAISVKKDSTSIVEAISAEDIGKLPDVSIAESISRLPGLAAQRVAGRAQVISGARPVARLLDHAAERPRAGQHRRQPQRRIRPVPVRADERRDRLQNA
jgi:hypothetical protein